MLLEFPQRHRIPGSEKLVEWLLARNTRPLIAPQERNREVIGDITKRQPFIEVGCWLQVTVNSITGGFGDGAQTIALQLLDDHKVAVIVNDGHNSPSRRPKLREVYTALSSRYGESRARNLVLGAPAMTIKFQFIGDDIYE